MARGVRPALGFEMLEEDQQADVDRALAGARPAGDLDERLRWRARGWPDIAMYQPLFEIAARGAAAGHRARPRSGGVAPHRPRGIGIARRAAEGLASRLPADTAREAAIAGVIREGHCGLLPEARLPTMVDAWHARNVTMARRLAAALDRGLPVVVIVGRGHQAAGGLPAQLAALRPGTRQLVVDMIEASDGTRARRRRRAPRPAMSSGSRPPSSAAIPVRASAARPDDRGGVVVSERESRQMTRVGRLFGDGNASLAAGACARECGAPRPRRDGRLRLRPRRLCVDRRGARARRRRRAGALAHARAGASRSSPITRARGH